MSDFEDAAFLLESWTSPEKRKRKKDSKKDIKGVKHKNSMKAPEGSTQKKKKKSKFKEAMEARKEKKKGKKKKKKDRSGVELDDSFILTPAKYAASTPRRDEEPTPDRLTQDSTKRRKKKVAFNLSPGYIRVKRPKFVSPEEKEAGKRSGVTVMGHSWSQENDSQGTSDDVNSQDLFITQKTFRASPYEPSSGEASDNTFGASPRVFTQRDMRGRTSVVEIQEETNKCPGNFREDERLYKPQQRKETSCRTQREDQVSHLRPSVGNRYLDEPVLINSSPDVETNTCISTRRSSSTQTDNFFTTELSSYLSFCRNSRATARSEDLQPLDLSLPQRARKDLKTPGRGVRDGEEKRRDTSLLSGEVKGDGGPSGSSQVGGGKKDPSDRGETTTSPQSESEPKSADTTTSGEDSEPPCRSGKLDLTQVRAVQMRLNESFFFKTKGEGQSPRPESPLMKLAQGRGVKSRKGH